MSSQKSGYDLETTSAFSMIISFIASGANAIGDRYKSQYLYFD
jgi:hypothetical protein